MLPENLTCLSDEEIVRFITPGDRLVDELARRLEGLEFNETIRELEHQIEVYENDESEVGRDLELANERIQILEDYIRENKLEVPG